MRRKRFDTNLDSIPDIWLSCCLSFFNCARYRWDASVIDH